MLYKRPKGVKYTDMCIYIDNNIYGEYDTDKVYQYLFFLSRMLAKHEGYFKDQYSLDNFGIYAATYYYLRLTSKRQFEYKENGEPKSQKIKSILNYMKNSLYAVKVKFQNIYFAQTISKGNSEEQNYNLENLLYDSLQNIYISDFKLTMHNIGDTCEVFLKSIPYDKNSVMWLNIYNSVMLTFLNNITLDKKDNEYINNLISHNRLCEYHIDNLYESNWNNEPILFHLPSHMSNYIKVLTNELKNIIAKDLSEILNTKISNDYQLLQYTLDNFIKEDINELKNGT